MGFSGSVNGTTKSPGFLDFGFCQCKWASCVSCARAQECKLENVNSVVLSGNRQQAQVCVHLKLAVRMSYLAPQSPNQEQLFPLRVSCRCDDDPPIAPQTRRCFENPGTVSAITVMRRPKLRSRLLSLRNHVSSCLNDDEEVGVSQRNWQ